MVTIVFGIGITKLVQYQRFEEPLSQSMQVCSLLISTLNAVYS